MFYRGKFSKDLNHNSDELIKFLEKYDGENLIIFEVHQSKLDERKTHENIKEKCTT